MHEKSGKASFGHIYDRQDPREYFKTLGSMDYRIPDHGQRLFGALVERQREDGEDPAGSTGERNGLGQCSSRGVVSEGLAGPAVELQRDQIEVVLAVHR